VESVLELYLARNARRREEPPSQELLELLELLEREPPSQELLEREAPLA
jgi:hypothetical protein